jgi:hypothetical protein
MGPSSLTNRSKYSTSNSTFTDSKTSYAKSALNLTSPLPCRAHPKILRRQLHTPSSTNNQYAATCLCLPSRGPHTKAFLFHKRGHTPRDPASSRSLRRCSPACRRRLCPRERWRREPSRWARRRRFGWSKTRRVAFWSEGVEEEGFYNSLAGSELRKLKAKNQTCSKQ